MGCPQGSQRMGTIDNGRVLLGQNGVKHSPSPPTWSRIQHLRAVDGPLHNGRVSGKHIKFDRGLHSCMAVNGLGRKSPQRVGMQATSIIPPMVRIFLALSIPTSSSTRALHMDVEVPPILGQLHSSLPAETGQCPDPAQGQDGGAEAGLGDVKLLGRLV